MNNILIKRGKLEYAKDFSELIFLSAPSFFPYLFGPKVKELMENLFKQPKNFFSFEHSIFVEIDNKIAGMVLGYSFEQKIEEELNTGLLLAKYLKGDFLRKLPYLFKAESILGKITKEEYYLSNIAVYSEFRGLGLGSKLLEEIEQEARKLKCKRIVLDVEIENEKAIKLYEKLGYKIIERSPLFKSRDKNFQFFKMQKEL
ncbi:GNAT family N-acetyltransferase [Caldanaerobacter subterraneus KAk]|uniref:GNAT family N-acetyltransferase n=1 Tax=Caldanaerobacter subterraneus TaxID=911092 RepID=UPI0032C19EBD